jgi:DNA-binding MarR family transcriptional regulator
MTAQILKNHLERVLSPFDLTGEQFHLLKNTNTSSGYSQNELCRLVDKSPANLTRILDRLEKKELVIRMDNPEDRRSSLVFQTKQGESLVKQVSSLFQKLSAEVEKGIKVEERKIFHKVLNQIDLNLQNLSEQYGE